jgi:hypothetical protein
MVNEIRSDLEHFVQFSVLGKRVRPNEATVRVRVCGWLLTDGTYRTHGSNRTFGGNLLGPMSPIELVTPKAWGRRIPSATGLLDAPNTWHSRADLTLILRETTDL